MLPAACAPWTIWDRLLLVFAYSSARPARAALSYSRATSVRQRHSPVGLEKDDPDGHPQAEALQRLIGIKAADVRLECLLNGLSIRHRYVCSLAVAGA